MTKNWDQILATHPEANFLQSSAWAKVNEAVGHKVILHDFGHNDLCLMIIKKAKRGTYMEIPGGPLLDWKNTAKTSAIFQEIRSLARAEHCAFVRFRPQLLNTPENQKIIAKTGARPAPMHLHAEHTVILDLTQSEETLLANMRRQTRYEVRRSQKLDIKIKVRTDRKIFEEFHQVQKETAAKQHFIPSDLQTLLAQHDAFGENAKMYIAYTEQDGERANIAYGLILIHGAEAEYFEAASTDLNRRLPGAYALQWQVIRDLKKLGIKRYNLWGIAPANQPHHRYAKVTTFKTGFGGEVVEYIHAHDIIIGRIKYLFNLIIETVRKKRRRL